VLFRSAPVAALAAALRDENKGVRDAATRALTEIGNKNVARAVVEYLSDPNITTRNLAAELLMRLKDESVEALLPYLYDADPNVRKFAVDILGVNASVEAVPHLIELLKDPDENVVISAVEALGNVTSEAAVPALIKAFDTISYAQATAAEGIGKIGGVQGTDFLLTRLKTMITHPASDPLTLYAMLEALSAVGYDRAFEELISHVVQVKGKLRRILLHAIIRIGERCARTVNDADGIRADLIDAISDDNPAIKVSAAKGLANLEGDDVTAAMAREIAKHPEVDAILMPLLAYRPGVLRLVIEALGEEVLKPTKEVIVLFGKLISNVQFVSMPEELLVGDGALFETAVRVLEEAWGGADEETRAAIIDALFRLDGDKAIRILDVIRNDPDPWLRMRIIELLAPLDDRRIPEFIARFMQDEDEMVREVAASTLESRGYVWDHQMLNR
jgi:HEAT repeat protein